MIVQQRVVPRFSVTFAPHLRCSSTGSRWKYVVGENSSSERGQNDSYSASQGKVEFNFEGRFLGDVRNDGRDPQLNKETYEHSKAVRRQLGETFGLCSFRTNQLPAINSALQGQDTFILMPTGGGKSLCYQLCAVVQGGVTVVLSPLVSLIHDQVSKLQSLGIAAEHLAGDNPAKQARILKEMRRQPPMPTLLYVTPEKVVASEDLRKTLKAVNNMGALNRFVFDEAHCISQWGHDFRPAYKSMNMLREEFPKVPYMALTATATPRVGSSLSNCHLSFTGEKRHFVPAWDEEPCLVSLQLQQGQPEVRGEAEKRQDCEGNRSLDQV